MGERERHSDRWKRGRDRVRDGVGERQSKGDTRGETEARTRRGRDHGCEVA